ncbi:MAG: FHA domain-containing protein, partial [Lachnospiraceae bacterium]|nr:FHA domain-containing protein [Lachnospiraceae bacterium]
AGLFLQAAKLYLEDSNSTNGTYLNRKLVPMNTPMEVQEGDRVVFATEEYVVSCRRLSGSFSRKQGKV